MIEDWRAVYGYTGLYEVSNKGCVRSLGQVDRVGRWRKPRTLKPGRNSRGYFSVVLARRGIQKSHTVHSLVARAFIGPRRGRMVLHGRQGKQVNVVGNLSYGTQSENVYDTYLDGTMTNAKAVVCIETGEIFRSGNEAAITMGISQPGISCVCSGRQKTTGGYTFKFN